METDTAQTPYGKGQAGSASLDGMIRMKVKDFVDKLDDNPHVGLYDKVIESVERPLVEETLRHVGGNQTKAGKLLGINRNTLRKKLRHYGML
ncbi:MAG: Fis family transcriptional regulator [Pseudomonadota bacterium]|nr:Fis family transcriptional regulator [Pseudomonadota bacterium]